MFQQNQYIQCMCTKYIIQIKILVNKIPCKMVNDFIKEFTKIFVQKCEYKSVFSYKYKRI